jgi:hypothetical protein
MSEKLPINRYFSELNKKTGLIESYDMVTGDLVAVSGSPYTVDFSHKYKEVTLPSGRVVRVDQGVDTSLLVHVAKEYNPTVVEIICQKITEGGSLTRVCQEPGMPSYQTICRWRRIHPEVDEMLGRARRDRAEYLRDKALETAEYADEEEVNSAKLRVETYKWAAGKDAPDRFESKGPSTNIVAPTTIIISTGIDRSQDGQSTPKIKDVSNSVIPLATEAGNDPAVQVLDSSSGDF